MVLDEHMGARVRQHVGACKAHTLCRNTIQTELKATLMAGPSTEHNI